MNQFLSTVAALLHDIGKFAQRADAPLSRDREHIYCPSPGSYTHVLHTDHCIRHVLPLPKEMEAEREKLAHLAASHHNPDRSSRAEKTLQKADSLSSGTDRIEGSASGTYRTARLESVFANIRLETRGLPGSAPVARYPLCRIDADDDPVFPREDARKTSSYADLYREFCTALKGIPCTLGPVHYITSLTSVLECFTWCIPSSTYRTRADISLFDHLTTTAAICQALSACPADREKLLLVGGDVSGIQKFIFGQEGQSDRGASRLLRARSIYVQTMTRSVWLTILDRLSLFPVAKIMDAGGRFVLLLPDTETSRDVVRMVREETEDWLLTTFQGQVRLSLAEVSFTPYDLLLPRFRTVFDRLNDRLEDAKLTPYAASFRNGRSPVLATDPAAYAEHGECAFCHTRPAVELADDVPTCAFCRILASEIGRKLPTADLLVIEKDSTDRAALPLFGNLFLRLEQASADRELLRRAVDIVQIRGYSAFSAVPVAGYVPRITDGEMRRLHAAGMLTERDGAMYFGDERCETGNPRTFAMLADAARVQEEDGQHRSIACLASCKADVDNLGLLFSLGFGSGRESMFSISRFAMLSRMLNFFFSAHLPRLVEREFPDIYIIFAGGDDLFTLGPWSEVVRFALRLNEDFSRFTGHNPAVTFSCGLSLFRPSLPMRALRHMAESSLEAAKHLDGKNAAHLFGVTAPWQTFSELCAHGFRFEELSKAPGSTPPLLSQGFLRRLLGYTRDCRAFQDGDIRKGLYLSHLASDLARNGKEMPEETVRWIEELAQDRENFPSEALGITYALYRTRAS